MKKLLIALLLAVSLVSCGNKREVNYVKISEWSEAESYFEEYGYNRNEVMELIKKDLEKADNMYDMYSSLIKTDNYIIIYSVVEVVGNDYTIYLYDIHHGDKDYINNKYDEVKPVFEEVFSNYIGE